MRKIKRYKLTVKKIGVSRDKMYSMGNIVNYNIISVYGNRW